MHWFSVHGVSEIGLWPASCIGAQAFICQYLEQLRYLLLASLSFDAFDPIALAC